MTDHTIPLRPAGRALGNTRGLIVYVVLANALAWLVAIPLWVRGIDLSPALSASPAVQAAQAAENDPTALLDTVLAQLNVMAMMFTPALAALITRRWVDGVGFKDTLRSLALGAPVGFLRRGAGWVALWCAAAAVGMLVLGAVLTVVLAALFADGMSLGETLAAQFGQPFALFILLSAVNVVVGIVMNIVPAAGEEIGWRGYLYPGLEARWNWLIAALVGGAIWGLWHAPVILLGWNFGLTDARGLVLMAVGCVLLGAVIHAFRTVSGSVWPAAVAHGAFNAVAGFPLLFYPTGGDIDWSFASSLGISAWIVLAPFAVAAWILVVRAGNLHRTADMV